MSNKQEDVFIELAYSNQPKHGMYACGDNFLYNKVKGEKRLIAVFSDGLGSGIKAGVLSSLTTSLVLNYRLKNRSMTDSIINSMQSLPEDSAKGISYSTCSLLEIFYDGEANFMEYDTPGLILFRGGNYVPLRSKKIDIKANFGAKFLESYHVKLFEGDRLVVVSDGVTQSGLGMKNLPLGWERAGLIDFIKNQLEMRTAISSSDLADSIVQKSIANDLFEAKDDISCSVFYIRAPKKMMILTGPPYDSKMDTEIASIFEDFEGKKVICGGTTSQIIARELDRKIDNISNSIDGVDAVTEGVITLTLLCDLIENLDISYQRTGLHKKENPISSHSERLNDAYLLLKYILEADIIELIIGTKNNDAYSSNNISVEMRRNVVSRLKNLLDKKLSKKVRERYY